MFPVGPELDSYTFAECIGDGHHHECDGELWAYGWHVGTCDCECHNPVAEPEPHSWSWSELAIMASAEDPCRCDPGVRDKDNPEQSELCPPCWARVYLMTMHEKGERAFNV